MVFAFGKRIQRITAMCLILLWMPFLLIGCYDISYPDEHCARWVSDDPVFVIEYQAPPEFETYTQNAYLEVDETRILVVICHHMHYVDVFPADSVSNNNIQGEPILRGTWKLKKNTMIFKVDSDSVWDGAYKEIRFTREELPTETVAVNP